MKNLLLILFLGFMSLAKSFGQINQNSNPAAVGIDAFNIVIGQTGSLDAVVENNGSDPMPAGIFRVYIGIDPAKMEFVDPASERVLIQNQQLVTRLVLHNANGVKVYGSQKIPADGIDVSRLAEGIYTLTITTLDEASTTTKVAVVK